MKTAAQSPSPTPDAPQQAHTPTQSGKTRFTSHPTMPAEAYFNFATRAEANEFVSRVEDRVNGCAALQAENARLRAALEKIADFSERAAHCTLANLGDVARAALAQEGAKE